MAKTNTTTSHEITEEDRNTILRIIYDKVEIEPPVGERYPILLRNIIQSAITDYGIKLTKTKQNEFEDGLYNYIASFGPIEEFFEDPAVSEIMVNGPDQIFIEKNGEISLTDAYYDNNMHVRFAINHIINPMGRYVNLKHPLIDSRLPDGSRVNAIIPPASPNWPSITIRRFLKDKLTLDQLIDLGSIDSRIAEFLAVCVSAKMNIVVAGNTSSGKTTFLNILAKSIPDGERIVTIEDSAELSLIQPHVVTLEAQPPDYQGEGAVTVRDLVKNSLRMRPDRIIVGEVRSGESIDMLQAMNTGHEGSMTTIHANNPRDALSRVEQMVGMAGMPMSQNAIRSQISSAIQLIIQVDRQRDGSRRLISISELTGMEGDVIQLQEIMKFVRTGISDDGRVEGEFRATGIRPRFLEELETLGLVLDKDMFDPAKKVE